MKVLLIQLIGKGGTQLYLSRVANALSKTDNEVVVLMSRHLYEKAQYSDDGIKIILFDFSSSYGRALMSMLSPLTYIKLLRIINSEEPDVIHILFEDVISASTLYLIRNKYPIIFTEHNPEGHMGESLLVRLNSGFARFILEKASRRIIVHGETLKKILLLKGLPDNRVSVIPHGDYSYYTKWYDKTIRSDNFTILFFGSIREYKGLNYLLKAIPIVVRRLPEVRVIIAGDGDFTKYEVMKEFEEYRSYFEIHNRYIPDKDVAAFFQRSTVVVLPYIDASQSGIIPIAYAFKKPVIATDVGALAEAIDNEVTGVLVPPRDVDALAETIINTLTDSTKITKMGEAGYNKMMNDMSWEIVSDSLIEVYDRERYM